MNNNNFLPISKQDMLDRGWFYCDFLVVTGDSYVDHPSFGTAIIARLIESLGFKVAILAQPQSKKDFEEYGKPRYATLISGGNIDSMVAHYSVAKRKRAVDDYTAGGKAGKRPDRACTVYSNWAREAFGNEIPIAIGGLEASLRRFAHYDYWSDSVRPSILVESKADLLMFGMGETTVTELALGLKAGKTMMEIAKNLRGVAYLCENLDLGDFVRTDVPSFKQVVENKKEYAKAAFMQEQNQDHVLGKAVIQRHDGVFLVQNPPSIPLDTEQMDKVYALPFMRTYHPSYEALGGVKSIEEVKHSIIHNRGCFGGCNFCALSFHQGRYVSSRSHESIIKEAEQIVKDPDFKGYIHDVGGPSANFRKPACAKQKEHGLCQDKRCLAPTTCKAVDADHSDYLKLLRKLREIKGVKKVFVRSGIRYDYMLKDKNKAFFEELVKHHISGQLKVAPEHMSDNVLYYMGKPSFKVYMDFREQYTKMNEKFGKNQYLVPYLMSSHPGATLKDAIILAEHLNQMGYMPEQVQDFYPTPGTLSTAMYYTGLDPRTMKEVYVAKTYEEKAMQRALLQWRKPDKRDLVKKALLEAGRTDLIGFEKKCLIRPEKGERDYSKKTTPKKEVKSKKEGRNHAKRMDERKNRGKQAEFEHPKGPKTERPARKGKNYRYMKNENKR
ncbi:MAG: YgiQ family radical SAM protein [Clostridia bacterium]